MDETRIDHRRAPSRSRSRWRGARALLAVLALTAGCASGGTRRPGGDRDVITYDQLVANHFTDAYRAVETLHSIWLRPRGPDSINAPGQVWVYLDGMRFGGVESLRSIPVMPNTVAYIRFFDGPSAAARWGLDHGNGVIFVSSHP
jgi:hypothetical protein